MDFHFKSFIPPPQTLQSFPFKHALCIILPSPLFPPADEEADDERALPARREGLRLELATLSQTMVIIMTMKTKAQATMAQMINS